ncbi:2-succinyl-6-hydroxy-2,4-cyclohexadiene-1-carboxylate synthase [Pseudogracilibacillus sp. ICA-222130]|uniref:2-succinyl-6-hydroxy-2, 4-cyclohexadiene-1-carboxylate synthase n=1 Tax=Pseudogracilibacillus sp. ICA-222130 TaxID=3134655 RepID=UPI0030BD30C7
MPNKQEDQFFTVGDATYRYRIEGTGDMLVLLHGFTGTMHTWDLLTETLRDQFTVLRIDLPGHGKTNCPTGRTMEQFSNDLHALLEELNVHRCILLGYSLGGRTALSFAQFFPEKVRALLLESASPGLATEAERTARVERDEVLAKKIETNGVEAFVDAWENIPLFATQKALPEAVRATIRAERLSQSKAGLAMSLRTMGTGVQEPWWDMLEAMAMPVTLIVGAQDEKFVHINEKMKRSLSCGELFVVAQAGHCVHVEQVEKFAKIVWKQLTKIE